MIRGVLSGLVWGLVAVGVVASVVSMLAPMDRGPVAGVAAPEVEALTEAEGQDAAEGGSDTASGGETGAAVEPGVEAVTDAGTAPGDDGEAGTEVATGTGTAPDANATTGAAGEAITQAESGAAAGEEPAVAAGAAEPPAAQDGAVPGAEAHPEARGDADMAEAPAPVLPTPVLPTPVLPTPVLPAPALPPQVGATAPEQGQGPAGRMAPPELPATVDPGPAPSGVPPVPAPPSGDLAQGAAQAPDRPAPPDLPADQSPAPVTEAAPPAPPGVEAGVSQTDPAPPQAAVMAEPAAPLPPVLAPPPRAEAPPTAPEPEPEPDRLALAPQAETPAQDPPPADAATGDVSPVDPPGTAPVQGATGGVAPAEPAPEPAPPSQPGSPQVGPVILPGLSPPPVDPDPAPDAPGPVLTDRPQPGFAGAVDGVRQGRLPRIGDTAASGEADTADAPQGAIARNARFFDNRSAKPPFVVLLLDDPASDIDLAALAATDVPLTLVIDPTAPDAARRAEVWHAAGQEVALLTNALPARGRPSDYEVALESLTAAFPQALALVDTDADGMQGDRTAAAGLVPALAARGMGLVTWDRGLNAAGQVAQREGLPAATIFRGLDAGDEAAPVIRRYLDRAAFKAQQDGRAMVYGRLRPQTVAALMEWALDGRAATLALAPVSALLTPR